MIHGTSHISVAVGASLWAALKGRRVCRTWQALDAWRYQLLWPYLELNVSQVQDRLDMRDSKARTTPHSPVYLSVATDHEGITAPIFPCRRCPPSHSWTSYNTTELPSALITGLYMARSYLLSPLPSAGFLERFLERPRLHRYADIAPKRLWIWPLPLLR